MPDNEQPNHTQEELFETIKNGAIRQGEVLLVANGKTVRVAIQGFTINDSFDFAYPTFTMDGICLSNHQDLYTVLYGRPRK